jgi:hypothetical protein
MRVRLSAFNIALLGSISCAAAAEAPEFVVPSRRDVPVIVNPLGFDASYTVVEGDFGLDRPGQVNPVIVGGPHVLPAPYYAGSYFPRDGRRPGYGRYEIEPRHRVAPRPAPTYYRSWESHSDPIPATLDPPNSYPIDVMVDGRSRQLDRDQDRNRDLDRDDDRDRDHDRGRHRRSYRRHP